MLSMQCESQVAEDGQVLRFLLDPDGSHVAGITAAVDTGDVLVTGHVLGDYITAFKKSQLPSAIRTP